MNPTITKYLLLPLLIGLLGSCSSPLSILKKQSRETLLILRGDSLAIYVPREKLGAYLWENSIPYSNSIQTATSMSDSTRRFKATNTNTRGIEESNLSPVVDNYPMLNRSCEEECLQDGQNAIEYCACVQDCVVEDSIGSCESFNFIFGDGKRIIPPDCDPDADTTGKSNLPIGNMIAPEFDNFVSLDKIDFVPRRFGNCFPINAMEHLIFPRPIYAQFISLNNGKELAHSQSILEDPTTPVQFQGENYYSNQLEITDPSHFEGPVILRMYDLSVEDPSIREIRFNLAGN